MCVYCIWRWMCSSGETQPGANPDSLAFCSGPDAPKSMNELYTLAAGAEFVLATLSLLSLLLFSSEVRAREDRTTAFIDELTLFLPSSFFAPQGESSHSAVSMIATNVAFAIFIWRARESTPSPSPRNWGSSAF